MLNFICISSDQPTIATFTTGTPHNSVAQGTTVTLTCSSDGYPAPKYIIRRGKKTLVQHNRTGRHVINNIQLNAEEESCFCVPLNKAGSGPRGELKIAVHGYCCSFSLSIYLIDGVYVTFSRTQSLPTTQCS